MLTFADFMLPIWADTPRELIGDHAQQKISAVASLLPGGIASFLFGFECPLGQNEPSADLQLSVGPVHDGRTILSRPALENFFSTRLLEDPVWQRIQQFTGLWADPGSPAYKGVDCVWLEFDMESVDTGLPAPSFFFGPTVDHDLKDPAQQERYSAKRYELSQWLVDSLTSKPLTDSARNAFQRCWQALPEKALIFQVGLMLPRDTKKLRVCVRRISPRAISEYLSSLGWAAALDELQAVIDKHCLQFDDISLTFDVGDEIGPKIGLECYFQGKSQPAGDPRWFEVMNHFVTQGLCTSEKADAFLRYPGRTPIFPRLMDEGPGLAVGRRPVMAVKGLHHIKIVYEPNKVLRAKGYLWAGFRWAETK